MKILKNFAEFHKVLSIHRRFSKIFWRVPGNFGVFQKIFEIFEIFRELPRVFAGFCGVPKSFGEFWRYLKSFKEFVGKFQRVSGRFWRFFFWGGIFGEFWRVFGDCQRVSESFGEFW